MEWIQWKQIFTSDFRWIKGITELAHKYCVTSESLNLQLISNNPKKSTGLSGYGLEIVETIPIEVKPNPHNEKYLQTKRDKLGHQILK